MMESQWITEYSHANVMDKRPRKRARVNWDVTAAAPPPKVLYCAQEVANRCGPNQLFAPSYHNEGIPRNASPPWRDDDKDGHYVFTVGENLTSRYRIFSKMGEGTFGQVLECWDQEKKEVVAIKIVRSIHKYREAAMIEIDVLQKLAKHDIGGNRCVQIRNWFDYRNHICIVFEKLGPSLYDFLRKNSFRSFPIDMAREFGRQLLESVAFMHDLRLIHTDLKPENILLVSSEYVKVPDYKLWMRSTKDTVLFKNLPKSNSIKLIDFGSTTFGHQDHSYVVSTRHYRAPEVILGLGWNYPCDLWSVGCILIELCSRWSHGREARNGIGVHATTHLAGAIMLGVTPHVKLFVHLMVICPPTGTTHTDLEVIPLFQKHSWQSSILLSGRNFMWQFCPIYLTAARLGCP